MSVDVAIVGGGPAGSAAAIALSRCGYSVALLERSAYAGVRIGETLAPSVRRLLTSLDVWDEFVAQKHARSWGIRSAWGTGELYENDFIANPYGVGWHVDRARFDAMLARAAGRAGATLHVGAHVRSCEESSSGWVARFGPRRRLRAKFLIDATGRRSSLARLLGVRRTCHDRLIGAAIFFRAAGPDSFTLVEASARGWWYSARLQGGRLVAAYMTDADLYGKSWRRHLHRAPHTRARLAGLTLESGPQVFSASSSRLETPCGRNWLAVGDAAMAFDPLSSQGVFRAIESGLEAAAAIDAHFAGAMDALPEYARSLQERFQKYLAVRAAYYGRERRWLQSEFWRRRGPS